MYWSWELYTPVQVDTEWKLGLWSCCRHQKKLCLFWNVTSTPSTIKPAGNVTVYYPTCWIQLLHSWRWHLQFKPGKLQRDWKTHRHTHSHIQPYLHTRLPCPASVLSWTRFPACAGSQCKWSGKVGQPTDPMAVQREVIEFCYCWLIPYN